MICVEDPIILFSDVMGRLPVYWQEFARYHAEIGNIVIIDSEKAENKA